MIACGNDEAIPPDAPPAPAPDAAMPAVDATPDALGPPGLAVTAPAEPITRGQFVILTATPENFLFVDPTAGLEPADRQGHFHWYLDDAIDYTAGWSTIVRIRTSLADTVGEHTVRFVLADGLHQEIAPLVEVTVTYTLQ